ncbi:hypothetical protein DSOL_0772 [Desulfosporosinus metallidurans]|uniref:Uncharacterized protein n=1 Tax=Desulfosporosinus metallidurans TaxID=1888891 RepID=A0A1Q8R1Q0_9FIRM|nr:hypothetical protein DSOL_0772 [Desulfosporosinus metallidurans]
MKQNSPVLIHAIGDFLMSKYEEKSKMDESSRSYYICNVGYTLVMLVYSTNLLFLRKRVVIYEN